MKDYYGSATEIDKGQVNNGFLFLISETRHNIDSFCVFSITFFLQENKLSNS